MLNKLGRATPSLRNCEPKATALSCFFATIDTTIMGRRSYLVIRLVSSPSLMLTASSSRTVSIFV